MVVAYLKSIIKLKTRPTGDKFLALVLLNSLMRSKSPGFLKLFEEKVLQRLYIIATKRGKDLAILEYSDPRLRDKTAAQKFHKLLRWVRRLTARECFSKWVYEYGKECPSVKGYYNKIRETLNVKKIDFYELPEKSIGLEQYQKERATLEKHWDSFKYNLESQGVVTAEEILVRAREIGDQIRVVKKLIPQIEPREQVRQYGEKLEKRMELVRYISNLQANDGFDFDNLEEGEQIGAEHPSRELSNLHRNRRYWRNIGTRYNRVFDKQLRWQGKTELIGLKIKEEEEALKKAPADDPPSRDSGKIDEVDEVDEDANSREPQGQSEPGAPKRTIEEVDEEEEEEEEDERPDQHELEDDDDEIERQNQQLERSIRQIEREKRQLEVSLTRGNSGSWIATRSWKTRTSARTPG